MLHERERLPLLSEEGLKPVNSAADELVKFLERFKERLTSQNPRFVERYSKGELHILCKFSISGISEKFIAYFQRTEPILRPNKNAPGDFLHNRPHFNAHFLGGLDRFLAYQCSNIHTMETTASGEQKPMFVDIVKSTEDPEICTLPSLVWFDSADRVNSLLPHSLYFSGKHFQKFFGTRRDGETGLVTKLSFTAPHEKKLLSEMVKDTPEIVQELADDYGDFHRNGFNTAYIIDQLPRLRIALGSDYVWCGVQKGHEDVIDLEDILVGPINFVPN